MKTSVDVILRFRNQEEREEFMGQLSDGWGENFVDLRCVGDFRKANLYTVKLIGEGRELLLHHRKMRKKYGGSL